LNTYAQTSTSTFNENWLKTVVSIEIANNNKTYSIGTGFIIKTPGNHVALVTAKHVVIDDNGKIKQNLAYRLNEQSGISDIFIANYPPKYSKNLGWFLSNEYDLACRLILFKESSDIIPIDTTDILSIKLLSPGANIFVVGFPLGLRSEQYAQPLLRSGIVSRLDSMAIIIDAFVFPGNSGGPVLYTPLIKLGGGLTSKLVNEERIIGLVSNFIPYSDIAYSNHTNRPRIVFEENSGLCNIVPIDALLLLFKSNEFQSIDLNLVKYR
jgi:S1-C subfamily serine protease